MNIEKYFKQIEKNVIESYDIAKKARKEGKDPVLDTEVPLANSLAERVVGLVSVLYPQVVADKQIVDRVLALEKQFGSLDPAVALTIAEEVAKEKFCKFKSHLEAVEAGIRIALGYLTLGYVSSPIEGFIHLGLKKTANNEDYFAPYYSGPIRSAGGTEAAFSLVVVDYLRDIFGYAKYDPTEDEIKRCVHECYTYHERINNLQYLPSEQEIEFLIKNIPVQISGDPSEDKEVYNYKDLPRIETNFLRSGFALVLGEGIAQKAPKILKRILKLQKQGFALKGWAWLEEFVKLQKKLKEAKQSGSSERAGATYMQDLVAGRPVFAHPSESGAFRLRYGRSRNMGYSTLAIHPATMGITDGFIAIGTQLKIEKPTKGCTVASCDSLDGPIVKLREGAVVKVNTFAEAKKIYPNVQEILYLGDILVPYGDFLNRNYPLEKAGYVEQYWAEELIKAGGTSEMFPSFAEAAQISKTYGVPVHPSFIYYWTQINYDSFLALIDWIAHGEIREKILALPYSHVDKERFAKGKRSLELIGCEHAISTENVLLNEKDTISFLFNLGITTEMFKEEIEKAISKIKQQPADSKVLDIINFLCAYKIKDKAGTFIGARMGRPEKAKPRKLTGSPHVLFPVGDEGGRLRSVQEAYNKGIVSAELPKYLCPSCTNDTIYPRCEKCGALCTKVEYEVPQGEGFRDNSIESGVRRIDIRKYFDSAKHELLLNSGDIPLVKGVRGTSNKDHSCEPLAKGLLRAKYNVNVNKDGTIRYDMTEMPITHFKPSEIGTSFKRLIELGYEKDVNDKALENDDQILEMFPHDIILPACPSSPDEKADDVFLNVTKFIDDELKFLYKQPKLFNAEKREDLVGLLFACMAPHTSCAVVGRLIGFSKVQALLASPYIHAAMRRDCDGDEAAVMMLMDLLLNFSRKFLPSHRGGTQDAPLVLNMRIRANEVDDMIFDLDVSKKIPLELYEAAERHAHPSEIKMEQIKGRLGTDKEFTEVNYSYPTSDINAGALCSSYKTLPTMQEKVAEMMNLCTKIRAVDVADVSRLVIERHFIRDTRGNLRKFSQQGFRCVSCNAKYRRTPLVGKCTHCGGKLIFTISEGSILKYMQPAMDLARKYHATPYLLENLELNQMYIESIFGREKEKQESINKWF